MCQPGSWGLTFTVCMPHGLECCYNFPRAHLSGWMLLSPVGLCFRPHLLLHATHFLRFLVMLLTLPCNGQGGIRLLFTPKEGLIILRLGTLGPSPLLWYWELPASLYLGGQLLLRSEAPGCCCHPGPWDVTSLARSSGRISGMRRLDERRIPEDPPFAEPRGVTAPIFASILSLVMTQFLPSPQSLSQQRGAGLRSPRRRPACSWENRDASWVWKGSHWALGLLLALT